jgi:DNA-binding Lrp family transcriptional regulator
MWFRKWKTKVFDRATRLIRAALQADGRQSTPQLADQVGLSATPVWRRINELEQSRVIRRHVVLLERQKFQVRHGPQGRAGCSQAGQATSGQPEHAIRPQGLHAMC